MCSKTYAALLQILGTNWKTLLIIFLGNLNCIAINLDDIHCPDNTLLRS